MSDRWQKVEDLFHEAVDQPTEQREVKGVLWHFKYPIDKGPAMALAYLNAGDVPVQSSPDGSSLYVRRADA